MNPDNRDPRGRTLRVLSALALAALLAGCATVNPAFLEGKRLIADGKVGEGLSQLEKAAKDNPDNLDYRITLFRERERYLDQLLVDADSALLNGHFDEAEAGYRRVLATDPNNARGQAGLEEVAVGRRHRAQVEEADKLFRKGDMDEARAKLQAVLAEDPRDHAASDLLRRIDQRKVDQAVAVTGLKASLKKPVTLEFRDASLKAVFEVISRAAGVNFIFDKDVRPDLKATIFVKNTTIADAVKLLLATNQLAQKVLNDNTVLIYPDTPAKQRDYQETVVRAFYLTNADVKQTLNMIKTLVKTRDVFIDEKLNLLVMRDTPEAVAMAEKLIRLQDMAEPEVMLEVEVLEVNTTWLQNLGIQYPNQISYGLAGTSSGGQVTLPLSQWKNRDSSLINLTVNDPALTINLQRQDGNTRLLANPRIRVKNQQEAKILIGDRVPVITTTSTANVGVSESVNYLDVGLKLSVKPTISLDDEVSMKVGLEVSSIVKQITSPNGTLTYQVGTRNADTTLRLKDGETQVLAGLINNQESNTANKVPGLSDLPIAGRLFSSNNESKNKTEIVLLITPHIVRNITRPAAVDAEFSGGTDADIGGAALGLRSALPEPGFQVQPTQVRPPLPELQHPAVPPAAPGSRPTPLGPLNPPAPPAAPGGPPR